jgi:phage major head subunit gpT-like protein
MGLPTYNASLWTRGAQSALIEARTKAEPLAPIAKLVRSTGNKESYPWIGEAHVMRLLKDELESAGLSDALYEITNETYAISLEVERNMLRDDQLGAILMRVREMSRIALNFGNKLLMEALVDGTSEAGFDGVSFFNDSHPARGLQTAVQDNLLAGTGVTVSAFRTDLNSALTALHRWKAENNEPLDSSRSKFAVVAPVDLSSVINEALTAPLLSSTSNVAFRGVTIDPYFTPRLSDVNDWYLCDVTSEMPLIYQEERAVTNEYLGEGSDLWVRKERALFKTSWRGAPGYTHPGRAVKMVNS